MPDTSTGTTTEIESEIEPEAAHEVTAAALDEAARAVLVEVAQRYNAILTHQELGAEVKARTGLAPSQLKQRWVSDLLTRVALDSVAREEPLLSALCVNAQGTVGAAYATAVRASRGEAPEEPDDHAAAERLACYRHFDAQGLPDDGGRPTLSPKLVARRDRERKVRRAERVIPVCPDCNHALASTGVCDNCD